MRRRYTPRAGGVALALVASLAAGCGEDVTGVLITIEKEASLDLRGREVRIEVYGRADASQEWRPGASQPRVLGGEELSEPQTLLIRPQAGDATRQWRVVVSTTSTAGPIEASRTGSFAAGRLLRVRIVLSDACAGITCPPGNTCIEGMCRSSSVDPPEDAGMDGGADGSGGGPDGGIDAGPDGSGGGTDGGMDAGRDGSGGGTDGGTSGCRPDTTGARAYHLVASGLFEVWDVLALSDGRVAVAGNCTETVTVQDVSATPPSTIQTVSCGSDLSYLVLVIGENSADSPYRAVPIQGVRTLYGARALVEASEGGTLKLFALVSSAYAGLEDVVPSRPSDTVVAIVALEERVSAGFSYLESTGVLGVVADTANGLSMVRVGSQLVVGGWYSGSPLAGAGSFMPTALPAPADTTPSAPFLLFVDTTFTEGTLVGPGDVFPSSGDVSALAPSGDGLLAAGLESERAPCSGCAAVWVAQVDPATGVATAWSKLGNPGDDIQPRSVVPGAAGRALLAGSFSGNVGFGGPVGIRRATNQAGFAIETTLAADGGAAVRAMIANSSGEDQFEDALPLPSGEVVVAGRIVLPPASRDALGAIMLKDYAALIGLGGSLDVRWAAAWGTNDETDVARLRALDRGPDPSGDAERLVAAGRFEGDLAGPGIAGTVRSTGSQDGFVVTMPLRCR